MALVYKDKIEVETDNGLCEVQLHYGDITKLEKKDAVDVMVVSAFPGSYNPTPRSVIGALFRELKVNVINLAMDKEEDLRQFFSCWWSKPLSPKLKLNFKRLLCFEGGYKKGSRPTGVVGEVFRSLVSLCKNTDIKVIMPLLATGDQGYSKKMMLRLMVDSAIHWMRVGLPLRVLKIVVFSKDPENADLSNDPLMDYFQELKAKWLEKMTSEKGEKMPEIKYDVYLSYCPNDEDLANIVRNQLRSKKENIRIFSEKQIIDENESWQEEIFKVMSSCSRVITLLTPSYLNNAACIEQYNIALCCSRTMKRDYLAPLYLKNIPNFPTYMGLIQYIDCRVVDKEKINSACTHLSDWLIADELDRTSKDELKLNRAPSIGRGTAVYEVFISYCRVNSSTALKIKDLIQKIYPDWRIFIDTSVLQAGNSWQPTLYSSIESSKAVLALVSPAFVASKVCQEEFNLSVLLHKDPSYFTHLMPIVVEEMDSFPVWCQAIKPLTGIDYSSEQAMKPVITQLREHVDAYDSGKIEGIVEATGLFSNWRNEHLQQGMPYFPGLDFSDNDRTFGIGSLRIANEVDVFISCHDKDKKYANFLTKEMKRMSPSISVVCEVQPNQRKDLLDKAKIIVPLISTDYLNSGTLFEELNIGMCRLRFGQYLALIPVLVEPLRASPAFIRILCTFFAFHDLYWKSRTHVSSEGLMASRNAACLQMVASCISQFLDDPEKFGGEFKLLLSLEEIDKSIMSLKASRFTSKQFHPIKVMTK